MWAFTRRHQPSPESETAKRAAEKSLQEAQARMPEAQARLIESRRVKAQLQARIEGIALGQKPSAAS
ncbi:hypothetical protein [Streptomyces mirabilis]|uniref:hypothetical protein n=1 Tax=Streptomyces mirabilis TaxID=68239 RepID=UPI00382F7325